MSRLKKSLFLILCIAFLLICFPMTGLAGGTGSEDIGKTGNGTGGGATNKYWQSGDDKHIKAAAYRFDLVYSDPKTGNRQILKTVVVQVLSKVHVWSGCISTLTDLTGQYAKAVGAPYKTSGKLENLAENLEDGATIDGLYGKYNDHQLVDGITDTQEILDFITSSGGFGMSGSDIQKPQDPDPGFLNSYGYRILIQKIQMFASGTKASYNNCSFWKFAATRKDVASGDYNLLNKLGVDTTKTFQIVQHSGGRTSEIYTTRADIHISVGQNDMYDNSVEGKIINSTDSSYWKAFADWNNGLGYNILWFSTAPFTGDYSIDAACQNCDSTDKENKSYIIQDTTDWTAIKNVLNVDFGDITEEIHNYFYNKKYKTYCREEYKVSFPNENNRVVVEPGRYFTLNASDEDLSREVDLMPDFRPVKVTRTRICKEGNLNGYAADSSISNEFKDTGEVYIKYHENIASAYNDNEKIHLKKYKAAGDDSSVSNSNGTLTMSTTKSYTLPENLYRYIRLQDAFSMKALPTTDLTTKFKDVGVSNLPVSFRNDAMPQAYVQFSYELPKKNSKISKAFNEKNNYFKTANNIQNVYSKFINNKSDMAADDWEALNNSACVKMYGTDYNNNKSEVYNCMYNRRTNKLGDCFKNNKFNDNYEKGYSCIVGDKDKCTESTASSLNRSWDPTDKKCCKMGTTYNAETHICEPNTNVVCSSEEYAKKNGLSWNPVEKKCCPYNMPYNSETKKCEDKCPSSCIYGCCSPNVCAPMADENGQPICPTNPSGYDVIYRTIDLTYPFPGQNGSGNNGVATQSRSTGSNWCNYNVRTQKIDCSYNNPTSNTVIIKPTHTRNVYNENHVLYRVILDSNTINRIRNYNNANKYDDFTLRCSTADGLAGKGLACRSTFLRNATMNLHFTGLCSNNSIGSRFYTCKTNADRRL